MEKKKFTPSMKTIMFGYVTVFAVALALIFIGAITMAIMSLSGNSSDSFSIQVIVLSALLILVIALLVFTNIRVYKLCYNQLYRVSRSVVEDIGMNRQVFLRYPPTVKEFQEMNDVLRKTENHLQRSVVYSKTLDYSSLNLDITDEKLGTVSYKSFVKNIPEIIMLSQAFRNAFIYINYDEKISDLVGQSTLEIVKNVRRIFSYNSILIADDADGKGFIIYVPQIDSINRLKEEIELFLKNSSMVKNTPNGIEIVVAKTSVVIYPFSDVDDIITDLRYANRQGQSINLYIPDRLNTAKSDTIMHGSFSLNRSNQLVANLASIRAHENTNSSLKTSIRKQLKAFAQYVNADFVGVVMRDDKINKYISLIDINSNNENTFLVEGNEVSSELLDLVSKTADEDGTYFFSSREHLNAKLGNYLDKYSITSGFLYILSDINGPLGLVYVVNHHKDMYLDSYLRECAFSISYQIGCIIRESNIENHLKNATKRNDIIMKLSNLMLYAVDKETHEIMYSSETFRDEFGKCDKKICYKAIYGLDKPCDDCPMDSKKKMIKAHKNIHFETSLALNAVAKESVSHMLIKRVEKDSIEHNRFDSDFLINSYYSLHEDLGNIFLRSGKGNILLLSIENAKKILKAYGSEGYNIFVSKFAELLADRYGKGVRFYLYDNSTLALLIPDSGRMEIVDLCEKIYKESKTQFVDMDNAEFIPLEMSYISIAYPQEYPTQSDFLRHVEKVLINFEHKKHVDDIYVEANEYYRRASRTEFINDVIEKSFKEKTFKVKLQPMVDTQTKHISGAEILIRLSDDYRNVALRADEVIRVAGEQHKINIISSALIEYIGNLYQKYGFSLFKSHDFTRLSLNTDYSYFSDENFIGNFQKLIETYNFPKEFLSFEIVERELSEHYDVFKEICSKLKSMGVHLAVDQYTGRYVSLDKVKAVGIPEIKISRMVVKDVDVNQNNLDQLKDIINNAKSLGLDASLVGVENKDQYFIIRDLNNVSLMQGFFFYEPLELPQLIESIKIN